MAEIVTVTLSDGSQRTGRRGWAERYVMLHPDARIDSAGASESALSEADAIAERFPEIPQSVLDALEAAGFGGREAIDAASDDELLAVEGVGPATLAKLRAGAS